MKGDVKRLFYYTLIESTLTVNHSVHSESKTLFSLFALSVTLNHDRFKFDAIRTICVVHTGEAGDTSTQPGINVGILRF